MKAVWMDERTICLKVRQCSHHGCIFCGFEKGTDKNTTAQDVWQQLEDYKEVYKGFPEYFRVFNSGSFFDFEQLQVPWKEIVKYLKENGVKKLRIESRIEFIPNERPEIEMEVCIGLETVFPNRSIEINKGFDFETVKKLVTENTNFKYVIYILAKPYVADNEIAKEEFRESLKKSLELPNVLQVHAMYCRPAKGTKLNEFWKSGEWTGMPLKFYYEVVKSFNDNRLTWDGAMPFFVSCPKKKLAKDLEKSED